MRKVSGGSSFLPGLTSSQIPTYGSYIHLGLIISKLSFPLFMTFCALSFNSCLAFFSLRYESIFVTEGFSITSLYFNCLVVGTFWGGSLGFQISGSQAFGEKKKNDVADYFQHSVSLTLFSSIIFTLLTFILSPMLISLMTSEHEVIESFTFFIRSYSLTIPLWSVTQIYNRLSLITQNPDLCLYASWYGVASHAICLLLFNYSLGYVKAAVGFSYTINFSVNFIYFWLYYKKNNPFGILKPWSKEIMMNWDGLLFQLKLGVFPFFNYIFYMGSLEFVALLGLLIDDINFTVLTIYMNILAIIVVMSEALGNSMSMLSSFFIGKRNGSMLRKVYYTSLGLSTILQLVFIFIMIVFSESILGLYSSNKEFIRLGTENIYWFAAVISLNSYHFVPSEFIIVFGNQSISIYSCLIGKYVCQFGLALILIGKYKLKGVMIGMIFGQIVCLLIFAFYIRNYIDFDNFKNVSSAHMIAVVDTENAPQIELENRLISSDDFEAPIETQLKKLEKNYEYRTSS